MIAKIHKCCYAASVSQKGHGTRAKLSWRGLGTNLKNHKNMAVPDGKPQNAKSPGNYRGLGLGLGFGLESGIVIV